MLCRGVRNILILCVGLAFSQITFGQVPVTVDIPVSVPLEITNIQVIPSSYGLKSITCSLRNTGTQRLLAVEINWSLHYKDGKTGHDVSRLDYWQSWDGSLQPYQSDSLELGESTSEDPKTGLPVEDPVVSVDISLAYAQFADGTVVGPDTAAMSAWLSDERAAKSATVHDLMQQYQSGGESSLLSALKNDRFSQSLIGNSVRLELLNLYEHQGTAAVLSQLKSLAAIKLPK